MANKGVYLHKDGEEYHCDDCGEKHVSHWEMLMFQEVAEREGNGPSQATVGNDELILWAQLHNAKFVDEPRQPQYT